ncbi:M48 family metallopeptidase [Comamonas sp. GB3 AK4-5]|uniref:M48 family metallopeptidase n=1 Tax=Comamonas sp. GB3 AK4-5 TaxID=3231487 RepID=UPI00351E37B6
MLQAPGQALLWGSQDFQHPAATHQILLQDGIRVAYKLERAARRSIGFQVSEHGLSIRAPRGLSMAQLEASIHEKSRWIAQKLQEQRERAGQVQAQRIAWVDGAALPFLGGLLTLHLNLAAPRGGSLLAVGEGAWSLHLPVAANAGAAQVRAGVAAWWLRHARGLFTERLQHYAPQLGVQWRSLRLSNARTRWGSAKSDGSIMLNWRLLHCRLAVLDYVVVHELSHLRVMDHSPRFWAVVAEASPGYAALRAELREHASPLWA